jgi:hypothetical protein
VADLLVIRTFPADKLPLRDKLLSITFPAAVPEADDGLEDDSDGLEDGVDSASDPEELPVEDSEDPTETPTEPVEGGSGNSMIYAGIAAFVAVLAAAAVIVILIQKKKGQK